MRRRRCTPSGAKQATEHLLELGHRRIGAIAGAPGLVRDRGAAASASAPRSPRAGILLDPELIVYSDWRIAARQRGRASSCSSLPDPPTAIFGFNDNVAIGALHAARRRGPLACPTISRSSASTTPIQAAIVTPQLTSVRQPLAEMGRMGVSLLMRLIDGQRVDALRLELSTTLVVRESTAPPRAEPVRVARRRGARPRRRRGRRRRSRSAAGRDNAYVVHAARLRRAAGARAASTARS